MTKVCRAALLLVIMAMVSVSTVSAAVRLGVTGGVGATMLHSERELGWRWTQGYVAGVSADLALSDFIGLRSDLVIAQRGASKYWTVAMPAITEQETRVQFTNLEMPLLMTARIDRAASVRPFVFAGPVMTITLSRSIHQRERGLDSSSDYHLPYFSDVHETFKDWQSIFLSGILGFGLEIPLKNRMLQIDGRYQAGFTSHEILSDYAGKSLDRGFMLNVSYYFINLGKKS